MDIDKLIEEKTECFTGNGYYYFTYVTPEDCKKIVEEALKQGQSLPIDSVNQRSELLLAYTNFIQQPAIDGAYTHDEYIEMFLSQ